MKFYEFYISKIKVSMLLEKNAFLQLLINSIE